MASKAARLIVLTGERREIDLDPARKYAIGRDEQADLRFQNDLVSRRHAQLEAKPEGWHIVDLNSMNGTAIDDDVLPPGGTRLLSSGAEISLSNGAARVLFEAVKVTVEPL